MVPPHSYPGQDPEPPEVAAVAEHEVLLQESDSDVITGEQDTVQGFAGEQFVVTEEVMRRVHVYPLGLHEQS